MDIAPKTPAAWAALGDPYDCSGYLGPLYPKEPINDGREPWLMCSYDRPAYMLWNAIASNLHKRGRSDDRIREWLQSKATRWALDGSLGDAITELADKWADEHIAQS